MTNKIDKLFNKFLKGKALPEDLNKHELKNAQKDIKKKTSHLTKKETLNGD